MKNKIEVRLHFVSDCPSGGCSCAPDKNMVEFEKFANKLVSKFGEDNLLFEAYNSINIKRFPFLKDTNAPVITVGKKVVSSGKLPSYADLEKEVSSDIKVD